MNEKLVNTDIHDTNHYSAGGIALSGKSEQVFIRVRGGAYVIAPFSSSEYIEKIESIQNIMLAKATGVEVSDDEYKSLREELIRDEYIKPLLPRFVITNRNLPQFWSYIKTKFSTYKERRQYIYSEFQPLITGLESGSLAYTTEEEEKIRPLHGIVSSQEVSNKLSNQVDGNASMNTNANAVISPIKILFLAANPLDTSSLRLGEEVRTIDERLRTTQFREKFELVQHHALRVTDLSEALLRHQPHIVHFSGHGSSSGQIILEDVTGKAEHITAESIAQLFRILRDNIRCVVLNACFSVSQAHNINKHIECVIGTSNSIGDEAAIRFAGGFYRAIGYGRSLETAFEIGRNEIGLANITREDEILQLLSQEKINPANIYFAGN